MKPEPGSETPVRMEAGGASCVGFSIAGKRKKAGCQTIYVP